MTPELMEQGAQRIEARNAALAAMAGNTESGGRSAGFGRLKLDDEVVELKVFDVVRVAPYVVRAFEAGPEGLEVIAVGGRKPEEGDGVRDKGSWPAE